MSHLTNDDLGRRIGEVEQGLTAVLSEQAQQGGRLDALEKRWDWLTATLGRLLGRQEEIAERTQVILQRHDQSDEQVRAVQREVRAVGGKVDALALACSQCAPEKE
jgi:Tfp pilus assembly protein PilN